MGELELLPEIKPLLGLALVFALMLMLEGASRYTLEMIRVEPAVLLDKLSFSMVISIGLVIAGR